jgi:hypothetical protein
MPLGDDGEDLDDDDAESAEAAEANDEAKELQVCTYVQRRAAKFFFVGTTFQSGENIYVPNYHKIYPKAVKNDQMALKDILLHDAPKFPQNWAFWFENMSSRKPAYMYM